MRRPATFAILAVVLMAASFIGCAGSSRQTESEVVTAEQASDQPTERAAMAREQVPESGARERYAAIEKELQAAVAAGEITAEQARERMAGMRERMGREQVPERSARERYAAAAQELRAAVEAGRITEEQARQRMAGMRERMAAAMQEAGGRESAAMTREQLSRIRSELGAAIEAGRITEEQARERMAGMRERMAREQSPERDMRERFAAAAEQIQAAAAAGEITEEQARERLEGMRERWAAASRGIGERERMAARQAGGRERIPQGRENALFNGRDLSGWEYFLEDENASMEDVWSVEDGILVCAGDPRGYLATVEEYQNFRLVVEWRWPEEPGNSGVLLRITGEPEMLPNCAEAQLRSGSVGDMYGFNGFKIGGDEERLSEISIGWSLPALERNEKKPGEWNRYEITVRGGTIRVMLNGTLVNEATDCDVRPGKIGLQSEGGIIHFRSITLVPIGGR